MKMPELTFDKNGLIPAIIQDNVNGEVLMLAYMNKDAFHKTVSSGYTHFWSRSRSKMWKREKRQGMYRK